ncbi:MAG: hypothetical protein ACF788_00435 [Novipirellula sp. JB048]
MPRVREGMPRMCGDVPLDGRLAAMAEVAADAMATCKGFLPRVLGRKPSGAVGS